MRLKVAVALALLALAFSGVFPSSALSGLGERVKVPVPILEGPLRSINQQASGSTYWFQVGATGDSSSSGYSGANVTIRTVYDVAVEDAHSYWVGGYLSNLAFVQVGYLTTVSTDGRPFCCAWFWEVFPMNSGTNCGTVCAPHIGPEFSAGPIGSWHNYSMDSNTDGSWSFYMDNQLLGTSQALGATDSGGNAPAGLAEVASTTTNKDTLGPTEFVSMMYNKLGTGWSMVPRGLGKIGFGQGTPMPPALSNPYGSTEITGVKDDFLAGSGLPQPAASGGTVFWPSPILLPYAESFSFQDSSGGTFTPDWVSFHDSASPSSKLFFSKYSNQNAPGASGVWTLDMVSWHSTNVAPVPSSTLDVTSTSVLTVTGRVYPLNIKTIGYVFSYPVAGAVLLTAFPDSVAVNAASDQDGQSIFNQLPVGNYSIRVLVPRGIPRTVNTQLSTATSLTVRVFGLPELLTALIVPAIVGVILVVYAVRKERAHKRLWESMSTLPPAVPPSPGEAPPSNQPSSAS